MMAVVGRANEGLGYTARGAERGQPEVEAMIKSHLQQAGLEDLVSGPDKEEEEQEVVKKAKRETHGESGVGDGEGGDVTGCAWQG